jgi:hypothetical protein
VRAPTIMHRARTADVSTKAATDKLRFSVGSPDSPVPSPSVSTVRRDGEPPARAAAWWGDGWPHHCEEVTVGQLSHLPAALYGRINGECAMERGVHGLLLVSSNTGLHACLPVWWVCSAACPVFAKWCCRFHRLGLGLQVVLELGF